MLLLPPYIFLICYTKLRKPRGLDEIDRWKATELRQAGIAFTSSQRLLFSIYIYIVQRILRSCDVKHYV